MGVAVSGVVDADRPCPIKHSVTMGWENRVCLVENLQRLVKLPMVVERNANAPLLAEVWRELRRVNATWCTSTTAQVLAAAL